MYLRETDRHRPMDGRDTFIDKLILYMDIDE